MKKLIQFAATMLVDNGSCNAGVSSCAGQGCKTY